MLINNLFRFPEYSNEKGESIMPILHVHTYTEVTSCNDGHCHIMTGISGPAMRRPDGSHVHLVQGRTSFKDNHYHEYCVYSGQSIDLPGGYHVHPFCLRTTLDDGHLHTFMGYSQASMYEKTIY